MALQFFDQMARCERRYARSANARKARAKEYQKAARERAWQTIDQTERVVHRLASKGMVDEARQVEHWTGETPLGFDPFERILESNELTSSTTLYQGAAQTHSVGRIVIRSGSGRIAGYGTGFLVSPRLLLTNNHVLGSREDARPSTVEFFYWEDLLGRTGERLVFSLDPDRFFETDEDLDFSLVAVQPRSGPHHLEDLGWAPLIRDSGKATVGEAVNILQHPNGEDQKAILRQNRITDVVDEFLHYEADTQPGSSGSPVFNVDWELAALHHSSVPKRNDQGQILLRGDIPWNGDRAFLDQIQWIANEGVRISSIVRDLDARRDGWDPGRRDLFDACFTPAPTFDQLLPGIGMAKDRSREEGGPAGASGPEGDSQARLLALLQLLLDRVGGEAGAAVAPLEEYSDRQGYRSGFLGSGRFRLELPRLASGGGDAPDPVLPYHNFTVVMNPERRLARYAAGNVHGRLLHDIRRADGRTTWIFDDRIPRSEQIGNDLYKNNPIDRGHLVRRLDAAWGETRVEAMSGNDDTFHYTNSAPQHELFNEGDDLWAGLEDHYLDHARAADRKISVFTGPVFRDKDPVFESPAGESARIPRQFWKLIAYRRGGRLVADAYLLSQRDILRDDMDLEAFGGDRFETFQVPITEVESLTGLDFGSLRSEDTFGEVLAVGAELESVGGVREARPIRSFDDIRL